MVLQSQQSRTGATRTYMFARRRRPRTPWFGIVLVLILVVAGLWWIFGRDAGANADTGNQARNNDSTRANVQSNTDPGSNRFAANDSGNHNTAGGSPAGVERTGSSPSERLPSSDRDDQPNRSSAINNTTAGDASGSQPIVMGEPKSDSSGESTGDNQPTSMPRQDDSPTRESTQPVRSPTSLTDNSYGPDPGPDVRRLIASADAMVTRGQLVEARRLYNEALHHQEVGRAAPTIRTQMARINETLIFSPFIAENDPFVTKHVIQSGDRMVFLARDAHVEWQFLARINDIDDPGRIRAGQTIKIVNGPFHAVVDKSDFRLDLYIGNADREGRRMFVRSFPVGLGQYNSTPLGSWIVKNNKAINPDWTNPRTGEHFKRDDPNNPIGEYWIGLRGLDPQNSALSGYGIHGTIEPDSIGTQASMGCVRMHNDDVAVVYEMLVPEQSTVIIKQ